MTSNNSCPIDCECECGRGQIVDRVDRHREQLARSFPDMFPQCCVPGCEKPGTVVVASIESLTTGNPRYLAYCKDHSDLGKFAAWQTTLPFQGEEA